MWNRNMTRRVKTPHRDFSHAHFDGRSPLAAIYIRVARRRDSALDGELPLQTRGLFQHEIIANNLFSNV